jgi:hypothetical protein
VFGPIDKGAGIVMPEPAPGYDDRDDRDRRGRRELAGAGAAVVNVSGAREVARPGAAPVPGRPPSLRQRLGRWRAARSPRPSGT